MSLPELDGEPLQIIGVQVRFRAKPDLAVQDVLDVIRFWLNLGADDGLDPYDVRFDSVTVAS